MLVHLCFPSIKNDFIHLKIVLNFDSMYHIRNALLKNTLYTIRIYKQM